MFLTFDLCCSIKREIGHLCHDERRPKVTDKQPANAVGGMEMARSFAPGVYDMFSKGIREAEERAVVVTVYQPPPTQTNSAWPMGVPQGQFLYQPETLGNEFSVLTFVRFILESRSDAD